jgi:hypothetical protein
LTLCSSYITMMEERYRWRMDTHHYVAKIASPWFTYKQVDQTDAKECSICWDECTSYIYCANSEDHIVCKDCSRNIIVNSKFVNPDASIDVYWKCPICRHENELGSWQFLPSTEQLKAKEASAERIQEQAEELEERHLNRPIQALSAALPLARQEHRMEQERRMDNRDRHEIRRDRRLELIDENAPSKFRWILSLDWRVNIVNNFKAWIMYTSPNYVENRHNIPPAGSELFVLKEQHNYERDKRSPQAPWFNFLMRTTPP